MTDLISWWSGSALQVGILVSLFWLVLVVAILALVSGNRHGRDIDALDAYRIQNASRPVELSEADMVDQAYVTKPVRRVRGLSS